MCDHKNGKEIQVDEYDNSRTFRGWWSGHYFKCSDCGMTLWRGRTRKEIESLHPSRLEEDMGKYR